jgi:hypothetical protein
MYKIVYFVPEDGLDDTKNALFSIGAGSQGAYSHCAWQTLGVGQFKPLAASNPDRGNKEQINIYQEYRVEMICEDALLFDAVNALKEAHPYEEPAIDLIKLEN